MQEHARREEQRRDVNNLLHRRIQEEGTAEKRVLQPGKPTRIKNPHTIKQGGDCKLMQPPLIWGLFRWKREITVSESLKPLLKKIPCRNEFPQGLFPSLEG